MIIAAAAALILALCPVPARAAKPQGKDSAFKFNTYSLNGVTFDYPAGWKIESSGATKICAGQRSCPDRTVLDLYTGAEWFRAKNIPGRWAHLRLVRHGFDDKRGGKCARADIDSADAYNREFDCAVPAEPCAGKKQWAKPRLPIGGVCGFRVNEPPLPMGSGVVYIENSPDGMKLGSAHDKKWIRSIVQYVLVYQIPDEPAVYAFEMSTRKVDRDYYAPAMARMLMSFRVAGKPFTEGDDKAFADYARSLPIDIPETAEEPGK